MGAKLKAVSGELLLLVLTAAFLIALLTLAAGDRAADGGVRTQVSLPPEQVELVLVDLNTADAAALMTLPGIGEKLAERILAYRAEHGAFAAAEELLEVSGIGEKKFAELKDYVTVG